MQGSSNIGTDRSDLDEVIDTSSSPATDVPIGERRRSSGSPDTDQPQPQPQRSEPQGADDRSPRPTAGALPAGATLLEEARSLVESRRFADAARVLESLERLRPEDPETLGLIAVTHAHTGRNRKKVRSALSYLSSEYGGQAATWRAVGDVAMARFQFDPAQHAARTAVHMDPKSTANWHSLAAAYAGNGWFEESQVCLTEAAALDPLGTHRPDSTQVLGFGHWQIGRAVNYWALTNSYVAVAAVFGLAVFGLLGLAIALSLPILLREFRVRSAPEPFQSLANIAWQREHRLRVLNAAAIAAVLVLWLIVLTISR